MLACLLHGVNGFSDARIIAIARTSPRKGTSHATPDFLSHNTDEWALDLLQRGRSEGRADASPAARISLFIAEFEPLFARLSDRYHLVAPDYPGFGHSDWPDPKLFDYTFNHIASVIDDFTQAVGLSHYTLYVQDYGGPVGFRMALAHPERVQALIVQNAVAHNEGLGAIWATRRAFWANRPAHEQALRENLLSFAATKSRHIGDDPKTELYDPDLWTDEHAFLNAPGQAEIQTDLFYDAHERRCLSKVAGLAAEDAAKAFGPLGQPRSLVRYRRAGTFPQRRAERGGPCIRRRTLRA